MHDDRSRLREALAAALGAARDARAPERVVILLEGAYRSLESTQFVDADMIRWAEASLGAWRRWSSSRAGGEHSVIVVDPHGVVAAAVQSAADACGITNVCVVTTRNATLEALATHPPTAIVFDVDGELAPTMELLDWLATDFPHIVRIGCAAAAEPFMRPRERALFDAVVERPPTAESLRRALDARQQPRSSLG